jgi:hypothetical protein
VLSKVPVFTEVFFNRGLLAEGYTEEEQAERNGGSRRKKEDGEYIL